MAEFFYMEGHGFFVWTSYGIGLITFTTLYFSTRFKTKKLTKQLQRQFRIQEQESKLNKDTNE